MQKNVIILTSGLSGSSVLTGLLARAKYWTGDATYKKEDYDTFENLELIALNERLIREAGYQGDYTLEFSNQAIEKVAALYGEIDDSAFRAFVTKCNSHELWVWKDPRLWLTIRFWSNFVRPEACRFIVLRRAGRQLWISSLLRRQIITLRYLRDYEERIHNATMEFLQANDLSYLEIRYEKLIEDPEAAIGQLNAYLGIGLSLEDLGAIYRSKLGGSAGHSWAKIVEAMGVYVKNYSQRRDIVR